MIPTTKAQTGSGLPPVGSSLRYQGIQCLRAVAAMLVIYDHIQSSMVNCTSRWFTNEFGGVGVDVFFVISGFVIALTADKPGTRWAGFLRHRLARVVPFYFAMSAYFLSFALRHHYTDLRQVWNSFLFLPVFDRATFTNPLHGSGWTLCFEVWFYLVFAAFLGFFGRRVRWMLPAFFASGCLLVAVLPRSSSYFPTFAFHPLVLEFCAGILVYQFRHHFRAKTALVATGIAALMLLAVWRTEHLGYHIDVLAQTSLGLERAGVWGLTAVALVVAAVSIDQSFSPRWPRWLVSYGNASYSLYLIQPYGILFVWRVHSHVPLGNAWRGWLFVGFCLALCLPLHRWVEVPLTNAARRWLDRKPTRASVMKT